MILCFVLNYVGTEYWFFYTGYVREEFKTQLPVDRWFHPVLTGLYCSKQPPCTGRNGWSTSSWILKLPLSFICNSPYNVPCDFWSQSQLAGVLLSALQSQCILLKSGLYCHAFLTRRGVGKILRFFFLLVRVSNWKIRLSSDSQKANKTVPTDQQGHFGWIKKKIQQICTNNGQ